jgi:hypothetical protein
MKATGQTLIFIRNNDREAINIKEYRIELFKLLHEYWGF